MKILSVTPLALPEVKVVRFARYVDARGYFTESFNRQDFETHPELQFLRAERFVQTNESYSRAGTLRGLHFQWDPPQGKLVRTLHGRMIDIAVDIRKGSPNQGRGVMYDLLNDDRADYGEWIWLPPGFAHGTWFPEPGRIEYLCSASYNHRAEGAISPLCDELDWSLCDAGLAAEFRAFVSSDALLMSDKDRAGIGLDGWLSDPRSEAFRVESEHIARP